MGQSLQGSMGVVTEAERERIIKENVSRIAKEDGREREGSGKVQTKKKASE